MTTRDEIYYSDAIAYVTEHFLDHWNEWLKNNGGAPEDNLVKFLHAKCCWFQIKSEEFERELLILKREKRLCPECGDLLLPCREMTEVQPQYMIVYPDGLCGFDGLAKLSPIWCCRNGHKAIPVTEDEKQEWEDMFEEQFALGTRPNRTIPTATEGGK